MKATVKKMISTTSNLGELIAAVYDKASSYSADPAEVARLAHRAIGNIMRRASYADLAVENPFPTP